MKLRVDKVSIFLAALIIGVTSSSEDELWCYHCNVGNFTGSYKKECNDPYTPRKADLVRCSLNEPQTCIKSVVFYNHVDTTVRGCVPAIQKSTYCSFEDVVPDAIVECKFCDGNACNASTPIRKSSTERLLAISLIAGLIALHFVRFR